MSGASSGFIVTANFTRDGAVAYRRGDGSWSRSFADAQVLPDEEAAQALAKLANQNEQAEVSDPYTIEVKLEDGKAAPLTQRERIRANGPTVPGLMSLSPAS